MRASTAAAILILAAGVAPSVALPYASLLLHPQCSSFTLHCRYGPKPPLPPLKTNLQAPSPPPPSSISSLGLTNLPPPVPPKGDKPLPQTPGPSSSVAGSHGHSQLGHASPALASLGHASAGGPSNPAPVQPAKKKSGLKKLFGFGKSKSRALIADSDEVVGQP